MTMCLRYIGLFLLTGVGGIVSGLLWLVPNGLMGGALGMSLSLGTLWLGLKQAREDAAPSDRYALVTGAAAGLLGGILMAAISALCSGIRRHEFGPPVLPLWAPLVMGVLYGIVLLWCYHRRLTAQHSLRNTLLKACGLCFLLKALATFVYLGLIEHHPSELLSLVTGSMLLSLLGAVPFAFLWILVTAWLDPVWSPHHFMVNASGGVRHPLV
jgi:hypothetical protein